MKKKSNHRSALELKPELINQYTELLRIGATKKLAAEGCGLEYQVVKKWIQKGRKDKKGLYHDLYKAVEKAIADNIIRLIAIIQKGAETDWKAAAWLLERLCPEEFGRHLLYWKPGSVGGDSDIHITIRPATAADVDREGQDRGAIQ